MDRNPNVIGYTVNFHASLSARRAWIEIAMTAQISVSTVSLSARRAWIEIARIVFVLLVNGGRSPQGERG